jgi:hypothetical protein
MFAYHLSKKKLLDELSRPGNAAVETILTR